MTIFLTIAVLMCAAAGWLLIRPYLRPSRRQQTDLLSSMEADVALYRQQLVELSKLHAAGSIPQAQFEETKHAIEQRLLAVVTAVPNAPAAVEKPMRSVRIMIAIGLFIPALAAGLYAYLGNPKGISSTLSGAVATGSGTMPPSVQSSATEDAPHGMTFEQIQAMVETLTSRLQQNPNDAEGWVMLARSNHVLGRYAEAGKAYTKAIALLPNDAQLLADYADALAMSNKKDLHGDPLKLIERALKVDPTNLKALSLAGTAAFDRKDYVAAVKYWDKIVQNAPADSEFVQQVKASIEEARERIDGKAALQSPPPMQSVGGSSPVAAGTTLASATASVSGSLTLAANLAARAAPEDTVFIFARAAQGPRMPLAILKKQVKDLPINFTLDDSLSMAPELKLSSFPQVVIGARISKRGDAAAQPGDLQGLTAPVSVGTSGIKLEINQVVGNP